jgi:glutathione synthase/RimK-type ligase-like ATP-grasp enzyme
LSKIIIVSDEQDGHVPLVIKYLKSSDVLIVDPKKIASGEHSLTYKFSKGSVVASYNSTPLQSVSSVWYRKPALPLKEELPVPPGYRDYSYTALRAHFFSLIELFPEALWISPYYAILAANNKMRQLQLAAKLGFRVPETVVTSKPSVARTFLRKHETTIIKPQASYGFSPRRVGGEEVWAFFYATKVKRNQKFDLTNLHLAPSIFQQAITNTVGDIRVAVVGDRAFASLITNPGLPEDSQVRDWRIGHVADTIHFEPYKLPKDIEAACIAHVKQQGLLFGALDLILEKNGAIWFLENNPNGQWAFVDDDTTDAIAEEIAHLLQHGKNKHK